jgi:polar amino acid transport system substrate-binding protein
MDIRTVGIALFAALSISGSAAAEDTILRIGTEGAYPPFNDINKAGELVGFDVDIAKALCEEMATKCSFTAVPWTEIIDGLEQKKYDLIVASMALTPERGKRMEYSNAYYRSHAVFVGDTKKFLNAEPESLAGSRIAAGEGTMQAEYVTKTYTKSTIMLAKDQPAAQNLLETGQADLLLGDAIELLSYLESSENPDLGYVGDPMTNDFLQSTSHITARKGEVELIANVNEAIRRIRLSGTYDRINNKYFPFSVY